MYKLRRDQSDHDLSYKHLSGAVFALVSLLVICIATTCLVQLHTRLLDKFLPDTSSSSAKDDDEDLDDDTTLKTVKQFRFRYVSMKTLH